MLEINVKIKQYIALQTWGIRSVGILGNLLKCRTNSQRQWKNVQN